MRNSKANVITSLALDYQSWDVMVESYHNKWYIVATFDLKRQAESWKNSPRGIRTINRVLSDFEE